MTLDELFVQYRSDDRWTDVFYLGRQLTENWRLGTDLVEIFPRHTVGVVIGQADAGCLIANDDRPNDSLAEVRWSWQVTEPLRVRFRARWRQEQALRAGAVIAQRDRDVRLRATLKF